MDSIFEATSVYEFKRACVYFFNKVCQKTIFIIFIFIPIICKTYNGDNIFSNNHWKLVSEDTEATVYNAVPKQCNKDFGFTASMFYLDLYDIESHKIIAMERTFMKEIGVTYGDVVKIEGTGKYDGVYQIQDTMNKRFAGQHKIDILVNENVKYGKWNNVKIYILNDKSITKMYTSFFKPKISKKENKKQMIRKRKEWKMAKK